MFLLGIGLACFGVGLIIPTFFQTYTLTFRVVMTVVGLILIAVGAAMTVMTARRKDRQDAQTRIRNTRPGGRIEGVCPKCGLNVAKDARTCPGCGADLTEQ